MPTDRPDAVSPSRDWLEPPAGVPLCMHGNDRDTCTDEICTMRGRERDRAAAPPSEPTLADRLERRARYISANGTSAAARELLEAAAALRAAENQNRLLLDQIDMLNAAALRAASAEPSGEPLGRDDAMRIAGAVANGLQYRAAEQDDAAMAEQLEEAAQVVWALAAPVSEPRRAEP